MHVTPTGHFKLAAHSEQLGRFRVQCWEVRGRIRKGPRGESVCGGSEDVERDGLIGNGGATGQGADADQSEELWQEP